jgi:phospholipid/cholesterol/gamma-HCH transport system permease protein
MIASARYWPQLLTRLGRDVLGAWALFAYSASHLHSLSRGPARTVFHRQLYFTGIQGMGLVMLLALMLGALVVTQTTAIVGGDSDFTVRMLNWTIVGELGPLLAAMIIVARSGVAIATELALMRARGEAASLERMRISTLDYLVVPRVAALTVSVAVLTIYFQATAITGGLAASAFYQNVSFTVQLGRFLESTSAAYLGLTLLKSIGFGAAIASVCCWHGLGIARTLNGVPVAAMNAVIQSLLAVFALDGAFAYVRYALF